MQLLFEEFFSRINKLSEGSFLAKIIIKIIFLGLIAGLLYLFFYAIYTKKYFIIWTIAIIYALAELAHYIRKSREKIMVERITEKNEKKNPNRNLVKKEKSKNKDLLDLNKNK